MSPAEIARQTGVSYASVYGMTKVRQRINPETGEQFKSRGEYEEHLARQRKDRKGNRKLSDLIRTRLEELGKNQSWLAQQIGVSR